MEAFKRTLNVSQFRRGNNVLMELNERRSEDVVFYLGETVFYAV